MQAQTIPRSSILIGDRQRRDNGDVQDLANSIMRYGLIQPIVLDDQNNLIAGGRRLAALDLLEWKDIPCVYKGSLTLADREELELEENVRRKDMTWQERTLAICRIHSHRVQEDALLGKSWGQRQTGELLGISLGNVSYALWAGERIIAGDKEILACSGIREVIQVMIRRKEDEVLDSLATNSGPEEVRLSNPAAELTQALVENQEAPPPEVRINAYNVDALSLLKTIEPVNHIITDPPYGINMNMLQQANQGMDVSRTKEEHDVEKNVRLLHDFIAHAFPKCKGFCILWCDQDHWDWMKTHALNVGWSVQRWPLYWIKTSACQNNAAQYNFTKRTEIAMVLRKKDATLIDAQSSNYWIGDAETDPRFSHPFAKPLGLWQWLIEAVSLPGDTILDPFAGCGTCPCAAISLDRKPIACEVKDTHYNECVENMKTEYQKRYEKVRFV